MLQLKKKMCSYLQRKKFFTVTKKQSSWKKKQQFFPHYVRNYWMEKTGFYPLFQCKKRWKKHAFKLHLIYKKNIHSRNIWVFFFPYLPKKLLQLKKKCAVIYREKKLFYGDEKTKQLEVKKLIFYSIFIIIERKKLDFILCFNVKKGEKKHAFKLHLIYKKNIHSRNIWVFFSHICQRNKVKKILLFSHHILLYKKYC